MSATEVIDPADVICGLKAAVKALECYHKMDLLKQQQLKQEKLQPPMYMMIPVQDQNELYPPIPRKKLSDTRSKSATPLLRTVCSSVKTSLKDKKKDKVETQCDAPSPSDTKFPEMRGGMLFSRCNCVHRDGLQDTCPLSQCQGQSECLIKPWPVCPPATLFKSRHPELFSMPANPDRVTC